jgi:hypothetical protein
MSPAAPGARRRRRDLARRRRQVILVTAWVAVIAMGATIAVYLIAATH